MTHGSSPGADPPRRGLAIPNVSTLTAREQS